MDLLDIFNRKCYNHQRKTMNSRIKKFLKGFVNIICPISCFACGKKLNLENKLPLCAECFQKIKWNPLPYCSRCGRSLSANIRYSPICAECKNAGFRFTRAWSCCLYEGVIKEVIVRFKYSESMYLIPIFKEILKKFIRENIDANFVDIIIPVPLFNSKLRERGFNQSEIIASLVEEILNKPVLADILKKIRPTKPQQELSRNARLSNLKDAFSVTRPDYIRDKNVLLIDDVLTTGATLNECAKVLKELSQKNIFALTLARG